MFRAHQILILSLIFAIQLYRTVIVRNSYHNLYRTMCVIAHDEKTTTTTANKSELLLHLAHVYASTSPAYITFNDLFILLSRFIHF